MQLSESRRVSPLVVIGVYESYTAHLVPVKLFSAFPLSCFLL